MLETIGQDSRTTKEASLNKNISGEGIQKGPMGSKEIEKKAETEEEARIRKTCHEGDEGVI